jgi:hypothetical protein
LRQKTDIYSMQLHTQGKRESGGKRKRNWDFQFLCDMLFPVWIKLFHVILHAYTCLDACSLKPAFRLYSKTNSFSGKYELPISTIPIYKIS